VLTFYGGAIADHVPRRLIVVGADPRASTPEELARFMQDDTERLRKIIKAANIKPAQ